MSKGKKASKAKVANERVAQPQMKVVTVDVCRACKTQCQRGLRYIEQMAEPGAVGFGVPCILSIGRSPK